MPETIISEFATKDRVCIDKDTSLVGVITAVQWRGVNAVNYEVSWVTNGKAESHIIEGWRLSYAAS